MTRPPALTYKALELRIKGLSYKQIAERLNIPVRTVQRLITPE